MANETDIDKVEDSLKARGDLKLAAEILAGTLEVEVLPDTAGGFKRPILRKGRISICYLDTDFDRIKSPEVVAQDGFNKFGFFLAAKSRRGPGGINDLIRLVYKWYVGFRPMGHEKLISVKTELYQRETDTGLWFAKVELKAQFMLVEFNDDPALPNIAQMTFEPPVHGGAAVVVTAATVQGENPIGH